MPKPEHQQLHSPAAPNPLFELEMPLSHPPRATISDNNEAQEGALVLPHRNSPLVNIGVVVLGQFLVPYSVISHSTSNDYLNFLSEEESSKRRTTAKAVGAGGAGTPPSIAGGSTKWPQSPENSWSLSNELKYAPTSCPSQPTPRRGMKTYVHQET